MNYSRYRVFYDGAHVEDSDDGVLLSKYLPGSYVLHPASRSWWIHQDNEWKTIGKLEVPKEVHMLNLLLGDQKV